MEFVFFLESGGSSVCQCAVSGGGGVCQCAVSGGGGVCQCAVSGGGGLCFPAPIRVQSDYYVI